MRTKKTPKFTIGRFLVSPYDVIAACELGQWIWFGSGRHARVYSAQWIANMNFSCVMSYIRWKELAFAVRNPEAPYVFKAKFIEANSLETSEWWLTCSEIPSARLCAATRDAAVDAACYAAANHSNGDSRVHVVFEVPRAAAKPKAKELLP